MKIGEADKPNVPALQEAVQPMPLLLEVGSAVQFHDPPQYGIIQKIGDDPVLNKLIVVIEMVSYVYAYSY